MCLYTKLHDVNWCICACIPNYRMYIDTYYRYTTLQDVQWYICACIPNYRTYIDMCVCVYINIYIHMCLYTNYRTYIDIYIYMCLYTTLCNIISQKVVTLLRIFNVLLPIIQCRYFDFYKLYLQIIPELFCPIKKDIVTTHASAIHNTCIDHRYQSVWLLSVESWHSILTTATTSWLATVYGYGEIRVEFEY
jgi:hypothetical protein